MAIYKKVFKRVVTTAGTPVRLASARLLTPSVAIRAWKNNTGDVWVGDASVADPEAASDGADCGIFLEPGDIDSMTARTTKHGIKELLDLNDFWLDAANNGDWVVIAYDIEED